MFSELKIMFWFFSQNSIGIIVHSNHTHTFSQNSADETVILKRTVLEALTTLQPRRLPRQTWPHWLVRNSSVVRAATLPAQCHP